MSMVTSRSHTLARLAPTQSSARDRSRAELSRHAAAQEVFADIVHTFDIGFVPELFKGIGARPAYLEAAWEIFKEDLGLDRLDCRTRRIIALAITTNEAGVYCIAAYPHAFRLNALDVGTCDKILFIIWRFHAFERFLSGMSLAYAPHAVRVMRAHWR